MSDKKIEQVRKIAEERYTKEDYDYHILPVLKNSLLLANKLNADKKVVEVSALLHDIGRAFDRNKSVRKNEHHVIGEKETEKILNELGFEKDFTEKVKHCVLAHRGRAEIKRETLEAEIIACADAMAHFDTFLDLFDFFLETNDSIENAVFEIEIKIERDWNKKLTLPEAKEIVKEKYEAVKLLLESMKEYIK
jgi:putative nucleotidyltransferase with HDIG domain